MKPNRIEPIARAPDCRLHEGQQFAGLNVDRDVAMRALDNLAAAQAAAAGRGRLPFRLRCTDEVDRDPDQCRPGPRAVLALLPLHHACLVDQPDEENNRIIEITLCEDAAQWTLTIEGFGPRLARVTMLWENIPPF